MLSYEEKRRALYEPLYPFWYNIENTPYALYDCLVVDAEMLMSMRDAADKIARIYRKTCQLLQRMKSDTFEQLGFPQATFPFLTHRTLPFPSMIQRIDMVYDGRYWKHYEINSDTPTFIMECYEINDIAAAHFGYQGINASMKEKLKAVLSQSIRQSLMQCQTDGQTAKIVFAAHRESVEDWETTRYLAELCTDFPKEILPLSDLRIVPREGLYTVAGERIHLLYRPTYPLECLITDYDVNTDEAVGYELLHLVRQGRLALCNPISAFLIQSKAVQALIWGLHEMAHPCYTKKEHSWIAQHFLPTDLDADRFLAENTAYVEKPVFGREGQAVRVTQSHAQEGLVKDTYYDEQLKVYQKYLELPKKKICTPSGETEAHILFGCFVMGDTVGAVGARAGNLITGNESYFLPLGMKGRMK